MGGGGLLCIPIGLGSRDRAATCAASKEAWEDLCPHCAGPARALRTHALDQGRMMKRGARRLPSLRVDTT